MKVSLFCLLSFVVLLSGCENPDSLSLPFETKLIDIGGWDMDTDMYKSFKYLDYGLPGMESMIGCITSINTNDGIHKVSLEYDAAGFAYFDSDEIILGRWIGEFFDSPSYDDDTISRGILTVFYTNN